MDLITLIIIIVIVASRFAGRKQGANRRPSGHPFGDLEKTFKQAKTLFDEYTHSLDKPKDMGGFQKNSDPHNESVIEPIENGLEEIGRMDAVLLSNDELNSESQRYETVNEKSKESTYEIQRQKNADTKMDSDSYYDLNFNREDIVKAIIFSEILNKPLCKRDAK